MKQTVDKKALAGLLAKKKDLAFAEAVWKACARIPKGQVATYGIIAQMIGKPQSARAVGNALNKNPFAPEIPCHRVVRSDGSVGGFASGSPKKVKLLASEGVEIKNGRVSLDCIYHGR